METTSQTVGWLRTDRPGVDAEHADRRPASSGTARRNLDSLEVRELDEL
jgi:hypothetical protein